MTASEQKRIEFVAPDYLRNAIVILSEMGLRPYKELMPMKKSQVDLENSSSTSLIPRRRAESEICR